jgi:hypothetical protein
MSQEKHFENVFNPSSLAINQGSTKPVTELSTRKLPRSEAPPELEVDNLTAIRQSIV